MSTSTLAVSRRAAVLGRAADYAELTRPKIALMIVATSAIAQFAASEGAFSLGGLLASMAGVLLVAASASALNQWLERKTDAMMARTCDRPAAAGRIGGLEIHLFAIGALVAGEAWLAAAVGWSAAMWAAATWIAYVWGYTPLKSRTWFNTVVGAAAGAMPVFIGWSAAPGAANPLLAPQSLMLFGLVFFWQFPHFMAIAWIYRQDYARAGLKMLSVTEPSGRRAGQLAIAAAMLTAIVGLAPLALRWQRTAEAPLSIWEMVGWSLVFVLGAGQFACAIVFARSMSEGDSSERAARRLLHASLVYLPAMLILFLCLS